MTPFDIINSVGYNKNYLMNGQISDKEYAAFIVNRGLSLYPDTLLYANAMNTYSHLDSDMQYDFYYHGLRQAKRWSKWPKKAKVENLDLIKKAYKYSDSRALEALRILTDDQIDTIRKIYEV